MDRTKRKPGTDPVYTMDTGKPHGRHSYELRTSRSGVRITPGAPREFRQSIQGVPRSLRASRTTATTIARTTAKPANMKTHHHSTIRAYRKAHKCRIKRSLVERSGYLKALLDISTLSARGTLRRSTLRNILSQSRQRYNLLLMKRSTSRSVPVASRNQSLFDPQSGHGMKGV
jgi:hypothetical protein